MFPPASVERLQEIGAWMKVNGEAIYGTQASPFKNLAWGRCTRKTAAAGDAALPPRLRLAGGREARRARPLNEPRKAYLLSDAKKPR